jgi:integrase
MENATSRVVTMPYESTKTKRTPRRKTRCMFKDDRGRWWLDYYTPNGKRRRQLIGTSKSEADRALRKIKTTIDRNEYVDPAKAPTFREFCLTFMERHGQHKSFYSRSEYIIERFKEFFGDTRISHINSGHIENYRLLRMAEKSKHARNGIASRSTIDREVQVLRAMLEKAVTWGNISKNPGRQVEDYRDDNKRQRFLTTEEIRRLLQATKQTASPILRPAVYLALQTGCRKRELLDLRWRDINFEAGKILILETKSGEPRHVPMSRRSRWVLNKLAAKNPLSEWVFESRKRNGENAPSGDVKRAWKHALKITRISDFRFHDLRHTFASHFAMNRGDLYALAEILGHSNPKITLDRYAHLSPEFVHAQSGVIDAMYSNSLTNGHQMDSGRKTAAKEDR